MPAGRHQEDARPVRDVEGLRERGWVDQERATKLESVARRYAIAITPSIAEALDREPVDGPLHRQFVPDPRELDRSAEERDDPIGDQVHSPVPGLVHRHRDRVLLMPLRVCPVYCRFCFRREHVGPGQAALSPAELRAALDHIRQHDEIWEVILTGGDPMILAPRVLREILEELDAIPHVRVVRLHSRVPVVEPGKVDAALFRDLPHRTAVWVVLHCNHASEFTAEARDACARLVDAGVPMLSQSVLLAGVNDDAGALEELLRTLVELRIKPYYLHHPDLAPGTAHFRKTIAQGRELVRSLGDSSGLCRPSYVLDLPGGFGKVPLMPCPIHEQDGQILVEDRKGTLHPYPPPAAPDGRGAGAANSGL